MTNGNDSASPDAPLLDLKAAADPLLAITVNGKEWKLAGFSPAVRDQYSAWLKADARQALYNAEPPPPESTGKPTEEERLARKRWDEERQLLNIAIDGLQFNWNSPRCLLSLQTPDGIAKAISLMVENVGQVPPTGDKMVELAFDTISLSAFSQILIDATPRPLRGKPR
jgi:hypothetical protein